MLIIRFWFKKGVHILHIWCVRIHMYDPFIWNAINVQLLKKLTYLYNFTLVYDKYNIAEWLESMQNTRI